MSRAAHAAGRVELPAIAVGGGLAGAAFALELARNGKRVIVQLAFSAEVMLGRHWSRTAS